MYAHMAGLLKVQILVCIWTEWQVNQTLNGGLDWKSSSLS